MSLTELRPAIGDYSTMPHRKTVNRYPVVVWRDDARAYAAVSDIDLPDLDAFVTAFRKVAANERGRPSETEGGK